MKGIVVAAHGRHYQVEVEDGKRLQCYPKGKKTGICVGDEVRLTPQGDDQAWISEVLPRKNLLYRSDKTRSRQFAANIDQILIVLACEPEFSLDLLGRALAAAWSSQIDPIIILNKCDLIDKLPTCLDKLAFYRQYCPIIELCAKDVTAVNEKLLPLLIHKRSILLGQSGMGKSTILNALIPDAHSHTQEISHALGTGKHTTTHSTLYHLPQHAGDIIDSPGFQAFGIQHLSPEDIVRGFPEFKQYLTHCRFYNCQHLREPHCGVQNALAQGLIEPHRYELYVRLHHERG